VIQFKHKTVKIAFYIIFSLLSVISLFMVLMSFFNPTPGLGIFPVVMFMLFVYLLPSLLLILLFTHPTPLKRNPEKKARQGKWLPIASFIFLSLLSVLLITIDSGRRCKVIGPEGQLWGCDFAGMDLSGRDLHAANMERIDLSGADLSGSDLSDTKLNGADLQKVNLTDADLSDSDLQMADLSGADLTGAILDGASLQWAQLIDVQGLTQDMLSSLGNWKGVLLQTDEQMAAELLPVCAGQPVASASDDLAVQYQYSMMLITAEGEPHELMDRFALDWLPESVSNTELVACFSEVQKIAVGTCSYDDGTSFNRYMQRVEISIYVARTAELLDTLTLEGPRPDSCPPDVVAGGDYPDRIGDPPYNKTIIDALSPYINEGGELPPLRIP